jgi:hypothetical protein
LLDSELALCPGGHPIFGPDKGRNWAPRNRFRAPVNDQAAGLTDKVVSGTPRDSLHAVDVVLRQ